MRKLRILLTAIMVLTLLMACGKKTEATAAFNNVVVDQTSITFNLEIIDENKEITGTTVVYLYNKDGGLRNQKTIKTEEDLKIYFYGLESITDFSIKVIATIGRDALEIGKYSFKTLTDQEIIINSVEDFFKMKDNRNGKFALGQDIDFNNEPFNSPFNTSSLAFGGTFDGKGFALKNITFEKIVMYTGVFGYVSSGVIKNVTFDNVHIGTEALPLIAATSSRVGIINAYTTSQTARVEDVTIKDSTIYLTTSSTIQAYAGAVSGEYKGVIKNVDVLDTQINVLSTSFGKIKLGGVVGLLGPDAVVSEVYSNASVEFKMEGTNVRDDDVTHMIGGIIGEHVTGAVVSNIISTGHIIAQINYNTQTDTNRGIYTLFLGGLIGKAKNNVSNGFYSGTILVSHVKNENETKVTKQFRIGGLIGLNESNTAAKQLVRLGGAEINITVSDDVLLDASQIFGFDRYEVTSDKGVSGTQHLVVNDVSQTPEANINTIADLDTYFTSEWIKGKLVG